MKDKIVVWRGAIQHGVLIKDYNIDMVVKQLCDAYLAQEEELVEINTRRMELIAMVEQLKAENQALKAKLEGTFKFDEPKRGEALRYITDDATGDEGNDGGQP